MKSYPIADLHNDLLSYLIANPKRSIEDPESKSSYPQMKQGNVAFQALAVYTSTKPNSYYCWQRQLQMFSSLLALHPEKYTLWNPGLHLQTSNPIAISLAFENAHGICEESQNIDLGLRNLEKTLQKFKNILYISLTWNFENRMGGGTGSTLGLKEDGKSLLEWMDKKKIAVDLSHASDYLVDDIFNFLEKKSLDIPVMASHSNMRGITHLERNLPDPFVQEIIRRKGLIGLNFFAPFIGTHEYQIADHVAHLFSLGGQEQLCFGADFFLPEDFFNLEKKYGIKEGFFSKFPNPSCYPHILSFLEDKLSLPEPVMENIAYGNFQNYIQRTYLDS